MYDGPSVLDQSLGSQSMPLAIESKKQFLEGSWQLVRDNVEFTR